MASVLKVNTLTGVTTAGSIVVTGEGNSTTTNLQQGLGKAWCLFDQTEPGIDASFNSASLTDTSAGKGIVNWTNNMGGALTYSCTMGTVNGNDGTPFGSTLTADRNIVTQTTSAFPYRNMYMGASSGAFDDPNGALVVAFGDLA